MGLLQHWDLQCSALCHNIWWCIVLDSLAAAAVNKWQHTSNSRLRGSPRPGKLAGGRGVVQNGEGMGRMGWWPGWKWGVGVEGGKGVVSSSSLLSYPPSWHWSTYRGPLRLSSAKLLAQVWVDPSGQWKLVAQIFEQQMFPDLERPPWLPPPPSGCTMCSSGTAALAGGRLDRIGWNELTKTTNNYLLLARIELIYNCRYFSRKLC